MKKIVYKDLILNEFDIISLYKSNGWTSYTKDEESLFNGIKNSLFVIAAYHDYKLVGLIRVVGDGFTVIYIQDILILEAYKRLGIGTNLVNEVINKFRNVRQICLTTDLTEYQKRFYESCGFKQYIDKKITGFIYDK